MKRQIFVAAGGKGRRLGAVTADTPKSMVCIGGSRIIDHIISTAEQANFDQIVIGLDEGKQSLRDHLVASRVEIEEGCVEPLTTAFFRSAARRRPDTIIGVNGDTVYRPQTIQRLVDLLDTHPDAAAALLLTKVTRPVLTSSWTYWRHRIENGVMTAMDEVARHAITTEYVMAAFRTSALKALSDGFTNTFARHQDLPFACYSWGWDYLLRLLLWKQYKVVGLISDDLCLNINHPLDLEEGEYFFTDPGFFRWRRLIPAGSDEPLNTERSLILLKPQAFQTNVAGQLRSELANFGLNVVAEHWHSFDERMAREWYEVQHDRPWFDEAVQLLSDGQTLSLIVEGKGAFYRGLCWKKQMREQFAITPTNNLVHATFSPYSFETEFQRELSILNLI